MSEKLENILNFLEEYKTHGCKGVVFGLSGGKDSTVVAMLAKKVWGDNLIAVMMPNGFQSDIDDSLEISKQLSLNSTVVNIGSCFKDVIEAVGHCSEKTASNIPPRLRMTALYAIAQNNHYRVLGTGNRSEGYIGWCTKWGDCACDINPLAHLTCSEVIEIGKELAKEFNLDGKFIEKAPSDGLTGKSDEENFGFTYKQLDDFILYGSSGDLVVDCKIIDLHKASRHKFTQPTYIETK